MKTAVVLLGLAAAFVFTPSAPVPQGFERVLYGDDSPRKSGLRYAVEGRLRWLGLI